MNRSNLERFDVVAHSMGNFLLMETARSLALSGQLNSTGSLGSVVLAAPDIDVDVFETQLRTLPQPVRDRMAVLVSQDDKALRLSRRISGNTPRLGAGDAEDLDKFGIRIIDLTKINDKTSLSHSKFADSPEIVQLIGLKLEEGDSFAPSTSTTGVIAQELGNVLSLSLPLQ